VEGRVTHLQNFYFPARRVLCTLGCFSVHQLPTMQETDSLEASATGWCYHISQRSYQNRGNCLGTVDPDPCISFCRSRQTDSGWRGGWTP